MGPEIHDAITLIPDSLKRSLNGIRLLRAQGLKVIIANVLMTQNAQDCSSVRALLADLGVKTTLDQTVTPMADGYRSPLSLGVIRTRSSKYFAIRRWLGDVDEFCAILAATGDSELDSAPCSAGHTAGYVSPYSDVFPCVQFPLPTGSVRKQRFIDIWRYSDSMNEVRSIRLRDFANLYPVHSSFELHAVSGARFHGRKYARRLLAGLRKIVCQDGRPIRKHVGKEEEWRKPHTNPRPANL